MPDWRATGQIVGTSQAGVPMLRSLPQIESSQLLEERTWFGHHLVMLTKEKNQIL